jgi:RNA polymerase sigma-70 factor (ECF subfamily)
MRIVQNGCRDLHRRRAVRRAEEPSRDLEDTDRTPEERVMAVEGRAILLEKIARLPEKFRVPLLMRYAHQRSYKEIAAALCVPESTVVGRLAGGLRILRRQLGGMEL